MLSEQDQRILDFERGWWRYRAVKEEAVRQQFGLTAVRYTQRLNVLIDSPEALAYDPLVVRRLRRVRATRGAPQPR